jgi:hypothetical protein
MKKNDYNLRLILRSAALTVNKKNFEFQIVFVRILNQSLYKIRDRDKMVKRVERKFQIRYAVRLGRDPKRKTIE